MVRNPLLQEDAPELQSVLDALDDPDCQSIITALDEPMTANEISEMCDIPLSTTYQKLDLLTDASLLTEGTVIREDGHHTTHYQVAFEDVVISLDEDRTFEVSFSRPARTADERLANIWSEVRKET